jgi:hypothetical protein
MNTSDNDRAKKMKIAQTSKWLGTMLYIMQRQNINFRPDGPLDSDLFRYVNHAIDKRTSRSLRGPFYSTLYHWLWAKINIYR